MTEFSSIGTNIPQPNLLTIVQSLIRIKKFIEGGELTQTLKIFGDIYTNTAIYELENISNINPKDKSTIFRIVLDKLVLAHLLYYKARLKRGEYISAYRASIWLSSYEANQKDLNICCLIAILRIYLEDDISMVKTALIWAACALKKVAIEENGLGDSYMKISNFKKFGLKFTSLSSRVILIPAAGIASFNPLFYKAMNDRINFDTSYQRMDERDFINFTRSLKLKLTRPIRKLLLDIDKNIPDFLALDDTFIDDRFKAIFYN
ncbi:MULTISPECIES: hypothetical protein [unclassified Moorena]|uniref:hypothetical protein n=1 Tax=unclassified Moorena TaxID=2683338 RepID=UPI0013FE78D4|nr:MULTISPECIES: hypothetical protein [unclassified Moorena]NEO14835.1 hypothetical protein [Moorena sp. SIO3E8]NEQ01266.1 hypothetical protein [Moorena sp. SIO3F7]